MKEIESNMVVVVFMRKALFKILWFCQSGTSSDIGFYK
jgi:hypothetical protein